LCLRLLFLLFLHALLQLILPVVSFFLGFDGGGGDSGGDSGGGGDNDCCSHST
jgi:hypothetical protein